MALLDRCAQRVQLRELRACLVGQQEANRLEAVGEPFRYSAPQLVQALPGAGGDLECLRMAVRKPSASERVDLIDLVQHELDRQLGRADPRQYALHGRNHLGKLLLGSRRVRDMEDEIRHECFLERGGEALDELVREPADEADRVGQQIAPPAFLEAARGWIQRLEGTVANRDLGTGERIQERRLPDVCVPGERDRRGLGALALLPPGRATLGQRRQPPLEQPSPTASEAPVGLELALAGPSRAHAAAEALEVLPHPAHTRQVVFELRELDLELAFGAHRVLREDVEDQLRTIDDPGLERVFEGTLLYRRKLVVNEQDLRAAAGICSFEVPELSLSDVRAPVGCRAVLHQLPDRIHAGGTRKLSQFGELRLGSGPSGVNGHDEPALGLCARGRVRLARRHARIMPGAPAQATRAGRAIASTTMQLSPVLAAQSAYPFVRLDEAKAQLAAAGIRLIDFGMGEPRGVPDEKIRRALVEALEDEGGYPRAVGLPELRRAIAAWCERRFRVELDPERELIPTYGSKEAIFSFAQIVVDERRGKDLVVATEPGYPVYERGAQFARAPIEYLPLRAPEDFLPDLAALGPDVWARCALLWVNYPNNPTAATAPLDFYEQAARLAGEYEFLLASDEAYSELWFERPPPSALQANDRTNVVVFNSLSKRSSMPGYRSGFVAASEEVIAALKKFRPTVGTAPQEFVQRASVVAWNDEAHVERNRADYGRKRALFLDFFARKGLRVHGSATMFLWIEVPSDESSEQFAERLLRLGIVLAPGAYLGPSGEGYVRLALVPSEDECRDAIELLEGVL